MTSGSTVLRGITVVDVRDGSLRGDVDIVMEAGRVTSVTPTTRLHLDRFAVWTQAELSPSRGSTTCTHIRCQICTTRNRRYD